MALFKNLFNICNLLSIKISSLLSEERERGKAEEEREEKERGGVGLRIF